jgi:IgA peptidase M64/Big-like domain-containing protein
MPRIRRTLILELCVAIVALSGCGSDSEPSSSVGTSPAKVNAVGSTPVPAPSKLRTLEDQAVRARVIATDADDDRLTFSMKRSPAHATITLDGATGVYELVPAPNYFGADSFEYTVSDGHGNSASAQVAVEVLPVADAPSIDANSIPAVIAAGTDALLHIATTDADGDTMTLSVSQVSGVSALQGLRVVGDDLLFAAPMVESATTVGLLFEVTDRTGLSTRLRTEVQLSPVSRSGHLYTVKGRPGADGLHWVITGDGFTANQQQDLLRTAVAISKGLTETSELARHSAILNIHVLTAISRDSGVDSGTARTRRTAFGASLGCGGLERVACLNWDTVYLALITERVPFDEVAVVLNTDVYVGNASASGLIVSRHALAPAIALHEMGHLFAGLADEYVDAELAGDQVPEYREGKFPNVTTAADPAQIPWRHWFADSARIPQAAGEAGVGRFEGAFYSANGFYRPKLDSIMRTLDGALGEVNAEAWLRTMYRVVPPIGAAYPAQRVVAAPSGAAAQFEIVSPWPRDLMSVRWYVDGVEVPQARGGYRYELMGDGAEHDVRVAVEDASGGIRAPAATEHRSEVTWRVSVSPRKDALKVQRGPARIDGWIRMHVDSAGHSVLGTSAGEPQAAPIGHGATRSDFGYALFDGGGAMLVEGEIPDPRLVRGPLGPPGAPQSGHAVATLPSGDYLIGIPEGSDARRLRIRRLGSLEKASVSEQWLDL